MKKERKSPTEVIEGRKKPWNEWAWVKFPRKKIISTAIGSTPNKVYADLLRPAILSKIFKRPHYTHIHTHPDTSWSVPSKADLKLFLTTKKEKTMMIALQNSKTKEVRGYYICRKTKKTKKPSKEELKEDFPYGSMRDAAYSMRDFADKYNFQIRFFSVEGYRFFNDVTVKKEAGKLENAVLPSVIGVIFLASFLFMSFNFTGNTIGNLNQTASNGIGALLFVMGLVGAFFCFNKGGKKRKKRK